MRIGFGKQIAILGIALFLTAGLLAWHSKWLFQDYSNAQKLWVYVWLGYGVTVLVRFLVNTRSVNSVLSQKFWLGVVEGFPETLLSFALVIVGSKGFLGFDPDWPEIVIALGVSTVGTLLNAAKR